MTPEYMTTFSFVNLVSTKSTSRSDGVILFLPQVRTEYYTDTDD